MSIWSDDPEAATNIPLRNKYMTIYGVLGLLQALAILIAVVVVTIGTLRASVKVGSQRNQIFTTLNYLIFLPHVEIEKICDKRVFTVVEIFNSSCHS